MKPDRREREIIFKLLQESSTFAETTQFLRARGLHFSAPNWEKLIADRIAPAVDEGKLSREDLVALLRVAEEHGKQHVFLYRASRSDAARIMNPSALNQTLKDMGMGHLLTAPRILDMPTTPTIADVRLEKERKDGTLVVKVIEQRVYQKFLDKKSEDGLTILRYKEIKERAVNLFRLWDSGLMELRIYSHVNSSDYRGDVSKMWLLVQDLFSQANFNEVPVTKAKTNLWRDRKQLAGVIRFSDSSLVNAMGTTLSAATGSEQANLYDDVGATTSLDTFLNHNAHCDSSNVWWLKGNPVPTRDIHVLLSGRVNEFAVTAQCSKEDYEHVLREIQRHNV